MKSIYIIVSLTFFAAMPTWGQETNPMSAGATDSVKRIIMALPEVKAKDKVYDSITNRVQRVLLHITPPDSFTNLYKVEAGYQGNNRFQPHFYFYVNPSEQLIYIEDLEQGDRTTLDEWRKRKAAASPSN